MRNHEVALKLEKVTLEINKLWREVYNIRCELGVEKEHTHPLTKLTDKLNETVIVSYELTDKYCEHDDTFIGKEGKVVCNTCYQTLDTPF